MEIKMYLKILQKRWWVVLALIIVTLLATTYFTLKTEPVYQARATYIVRISAFAEERNVISALNTLTSRTEIAATYAGVANSQVIKSKAAETLGISRTDGLSVHGQMKSGTNILEITVEGNDPALVRDYTNAVGLETVSYVESLYETYRLELLDEAALPRSPIKPNLIQNLMLGGILGLFLGIGLVIFMEYLKVPAETDSVLNILDQRFGIYGMRYFRERLHQEMSRSRRHNGILSVALVNIDHRHLLGNVSPQMRLQAMRSVVRAVGKSLRDEDVMATSSETELALLLPELDADKAKIVVERVLATVSKVSVELGPEGRSISLNGAAGIALFGSWDQATTEILIDRARNALESMKESTYGRVVIAKGLSSSQTPETKTAEPQEVKSPVVDEPAPRVSMPEVLPVAESLAAEPVETEQVQDEQTEEAVAVQDQVEMPEQEEVSEPVQAPEQSEKVSVETSLSQHHTNGKKPHGHKAPRNGNSQGKLELSEQES